MPRTLITGGFGFIATWLGTALHRCGHELVLVDSREPESSPAALAGLLELPGVRAERVDVTVPGTLDHLPEVHYVVHAAAVLGVERVCQAPRDTMLVNTAATEVALEFAARQPALERFLLFSTSEVYGDDADSATEDAWLSVRADDARWSYAISKVAAESLTWSYGRTHELPFVVVRPFNVYGALRHRSYAVGALVNQALAGDPITVHGDGRQVRAWCHVEDFVYGLVRALQAPEALGQAVNLGDDRYAWSLTELAHRIRDLAGSSSEIQHVPAGHPDIHRRCPDLAKARKLLSYEPLRPFDDGLRDTIAWWRDGAGRYQPRFDREDWPAWP